jgi:hypothetical protein
MFALLLLVLISGSNPQPIAVCCAAGIHVMFNTRNLRVICDACC